MKVVLLCGGIGKRMFPITKDKFLLKFLGKPLLLHQIDLIRKAGLHDLIIVGNPQNIKAIREMSENVASVNVQLAIQPHPLGIADALINIKELLNEEFILQSSNDVVDTSAYAMLLEARRKNKALSYILVYKVRDYFPGGYVVVDEENNLKDIVEKPGRGNEPSDLVNILVHLHTDPQRLIRFAQSVETAVDDAYERAISTLIKEGNEIKAVRYPGSWVSIKYPWHILDVMKHFLDQSTPQISSSAYISDSAIIEGKVVIADDVRVLEKAVIKGPAYIGSNSVVGTNCLIRDYAHIGSNTIIGYATEVKGSYIGDDCSFHHCYVGDSIIGDRCSFGFGTVLSNFRLDGKNINVKVGDEPVDTGLNKLGAIVGDGCKFGVNVSVMPGVKVGPNSIVGPHICLTHDLSPGKIALLSSHGQVVVRESE